MEDLKKALAEYLRQFSINWEDDHFAVYSNDFFYLKGPPRIELVNFLGTNPILLKELMTRSNLNLIRFPLISWIVSFTDLHPSLLNFIFEKILNGVNSHDWHHFTFIFNYIRKFTNDEILLKESAMNVIPLLSSGVKPLFISILPDIVNDGACFFDMLSTDWKEGKRDLAMASLSSLLKFNLVSVSMLFESHHFEDIGDDINLLKNVVIAFPEQVQILSLFRKYVVKMYESGGIKHSKRIKITDKPFNRWIDQWSDVFHQCGPLNAWPYPVDTKSIHFIDLFTIICNASFSSDKSEIQSFIERFILIQEETLVEFFKNQLPLLLSQCTWLQSTLSRPLLQIFASFLRLEVPSQNLLLSICQIFMDNILGSLARKSFVNFIASHTDRLEIGERCLKLVESFIEEFPSSRYVCLALIKGLLDGIYSWDAQLLLPFYSSYAMIARSSDTVMNDLILLLKKQIYSSDPCCKRIGARGVAVLINKISDINWLKDKNDHYLPNLDESFEDDSYCTAACSQKQKSVEISSSMSIINNYYVKMAISLLEDSVKCLRSDPKSMLILLRLLNESFKVLVDEVKVWIGEWSAAAFQENFVVQIDDSEGGDDGRSKNDKYLFVLDEDNPVAINFLGQKLNGCAPFLLNLLSQNEKYHNSGSLESIDALQTCSIFWNSSKTSDDILLKFETINYFRVILNEFQDQKVSSSAFQDCRLSNLIELQAEFTKLLRNSKNIHLFSELEFFSETYSLLYIAEKNDYEHSSSSSSAKFTCFLDDFLKEATNEMKSLGSFKNSTKSSSNLENASFIPLSVELIHQELIVKIKDTKSENDKIKFLLKEIEIGLSNFEEKFHLKEKYLKILLDFFLSIHPDDTETYLKTIEIIFKHPFSKAYCSSDKERLLSVSESILTTTKSIELKDVICKFIISYLKGADSIRNPKELLHELLVISNGSDHSGDDLEHLNLKGRHVLKSKELLSLLEVEYLVEKYFNFQDSNDIKSVSDSINAKNEIILFKHTFQVISQQLKVSSNIQSSQQLMSIITRLIQFSKSKSLDVLKVVIKESNSVLENLLISNVLRLIEREALILDSRESVLSFFKTMQQSTRSLQIICNHLKYSSNPASIKGIPALKRTLEVVIFKIKEILQRSGCLGAFWMGNLKHRDLDGNELSSQVELQLSLSLEPDHDHDHDLYSNIYLSEQFVDSTDISSNISDESAKQE